MCRHPEDSRLDPNARIYPFKVHRGNQPYDKEHNTLLVPLLSGKDGYWTTLDWNRALSKGQESVELPFSGRYDFVETTYVFPITYMVAPKKIVLACAECHSRQDSRLANLGGFYMPGRDRGQRLDIFGRITVIGALGGVVLHAAGRFFDRGNDRKTAKTARNN